MSFVDYQTALLRHLNELSVDWRGRPLGIEEAFERLIGLAAEIQRRRGTLYFVGNGASASMASHMALDMWKNLMIRAMAFNDLVSLTATSNDYSYDEVFARPLGFFARPRDMLVAISSSGRSRNILAAVDVAKRHGLVVVGFSAMAPDNPLRRNGDLNFYVPAPTYGLAETAHQALLHYWVDRLLARRRAGMDHKDVSADEQRRDQRSFD